MRQKKFHQSIIRKSYWLKLVKRVKVKESTAITYLIKWYKPGNTSGERVLAYSLKDAESEWDRLVSDPDFGEVPVLKRQQWIAERVPEKLKCNSPHYLKSRSRLSIVFYKSKLSKDLSKFLEKFENRPCSEGRKSTMRTVVRKINNEAKNATSLNNTIVKNVFSKMTKTNAHLSPVTIKNYKKCISQIAKALGVKNIDELYQGISFYSARELKVMGISYNGKDRQHLEREDVQCLVGELLKVKDSSVRTGCFLQLWTGCRPDDGMSSYLDVHSLGIDVGKTDEKVFLEMTPILKAYLKLIDYHEGKVRSKKANSLFRQASRKVLTDKKFTKIDRYWLRHTALTWMCLDKSMRLKEVVDIAGHSSLRMLDEHYASRQVRDQRSWEDAMPLYLDWVSLCWHGFLLECLLVAKWPELLEDKVPTSKLYHEIKKEIVGKSLKRKKKAL